MIDYHEMPKDGIRFEQLVRELLIREEHEVRWTGVGPDGGRDLLLIERVSGSLAPFERTWVVNCKHFAHSGESVGINDIDGIIDTCKAVGASGFLLACSTQASSSLVTRLREIEQQHQIHILIWDGVEIEKRLMHPRTFSLVHLFFPKSAATIGWSVFNAGSPSFWCGSHRGHFLYMSSRIPGGVPRLTDMERIIEMLDGVPRAQGDEFGGQERLRMRAVYFDNKNENYLVFADYLVPMTYSEGRETPIVQTHSSKSLLHALNDGHCLYAENGAGWYHTNWDIMRIEVSEGSDSFDEDHQKYYTPYLPNFEIGLPRKGAASALIGSLPWKK